MSSHYAIQLSLMLSHSGDWVTSCTYYNHGLEPPYGGVKSEETLLPTIVRLEKFGEDVVAIGAFITHVINVVKTTKAVPTDPVPDEPLEYSLELVGDEFRYNIEMESLALSVIYDKTTGRITFAPRDAYDISWQGFLFFNETLKDFLTEIKRIAQ